MPNFILHTISQCSLFQRWVHDKSTKNCDFLVTCISDTKLQKAPIICDTSMQLGSICQPSCQSISYIYCFFGKFGKFAKCNIRPHQPPATLCIIFTVVQKSRFPRYRHLTVFVTSSTRTSRNGVFPKS